MGGPTFSLQMSDIDAATMTVQQTGTISIVVLLMLIACWYTWMFSEVIVTHKHLRRLPYLRTRSTLCASMCPRSAFIAPSCIFASALLLAFSL